MDIDISQGWMPDFLPFAMPKGGLVDCYNLLPYDEYYGTAKAKAGYSSNALSGVPRSAIAYKSSNNSRYPFIGTTTKLSRLEINKSLTDVSKLRTVTTWAASMAYSLGNFVIPTIPNGYSYECTTAGSSGVTQPTWPTTLGATVVDGTVTWTCRTRTVDYATGDNSWNFAQYGEWVISTNFTDAPQVLKGFSSAANFIDLGGTPPKAKYCLLNNGHLIFGYLNESGTISPKKIKWSAKENVEDYTASLITGSDAQDLVDADGEMTGLANVGRYVGVFHENSITIGKYGGAYIFNFEMNVIKNKGAIPGTVVTDGNIAYFWDRKDFYVFDGVSNPIPIGEGVRNTVLDSLDLGNIHRITSAYDARRGLVFWSYPDVGSGGTPNRILCYNPRAKRFTRIDVSAPCLFNMHTGSLDMDSLNSIYPSLDAIPYNLDSNVWQANSPTLACVEPTDLKVYTFTGAALSGTIETAEIYNGDNIIKIRRIRPKVERAIDMISIEVETRMKESDMGTYSTPATVGSNGYADLRATGRFLRVKMTTGLHQGIGPTIGVETAPAGRR